MSNIKYHNYLKLKSIGACNFKGYELSNIIAQVYLALAYENYKPKFREFSKFLLFKDLTLLSKKDKPLLFTYGKVKWRKDYYELVEYVKISIVGCEEYHDLNNLKFKFTFNLNNIAIAWKITKRFRDISLWSKCGLFSEMCFYLNTISNLEKVEFENIKKYLASDSINYLEAVLTQYFKLRNIPTYTLQHGIIRFYTDDIPLEVIMYENMFSDYHLCWGQFTKDQFMLAGILQRKLLVAGYPKELFGKPDIKKQNQNQILVILSRKLYQEANLNVIKIISQVVIHNMPNTCLVFKLHPQLDKDFYEKILIDSGLKNYNLLGKEITIQELLTENNFMFSVSVNSTAYFESYIYRIPCLQYAHHSFERLQQITDDDFADELDFISKFKEIAVIKDKDSYWQDVDEKLRYILGYQINNYNSIFNETILD